MPTTQITSAQRFTIARITDLALDVSLAGRYHAGVRLIGLTYCLNTRPDSQDRGGQGERHIHIFLDRPDADRDLGEMLTHLEALLAEGPAPATQEGQPS